MVPKTPGAESQMENLPAGPRASGQAAGYAAAMGRWFVAVAVALGSAGWGAACTTVDPVGDGGPPMDGGPLDAGADAGPPDAGFVPAADPPLPQVPYGGGPLLRQISIVTVTWAGDPLAGELRAFDLWLPASLYWQDSLAEYGVSPGAQIAVLGLDAGGPAMLSDAEIQALLLAAVDGGQIPSPGPETLAT